MTTISQNVIICENNSIKALYIYSKDSGLKEICQGKMGKKLFLSAVKCLFSAISFLSSAPHHNPRGPSVYIKLFFREENLSRMLGSSFVTSSVARAADPS